MKAAPAIMRLRIATVMVLLVASSAPAPAARGAMGSQSRASIRISASVMPQVQVHASGAQGGLSASSNAPGIRYRLVEISGFAATAGGCGRSAGQRAFDARPWFIRAAARAGRSRLTLVILQARFASR